MGWKPSLAAIRQQRFEILPFRLRGLVDISVVCRNEMSLHHRVVASACQNGVVHNNGQPRVSVIMQYKFVSYLRVSTDRQGKSGLGLEAQRQAVADFLKSREGRLLGEHVEVESGRNNDRPKLAEALTVCRMTGATLVVAKIDRLARNVRFLLTVVEGCGEGGVMFCDLPALPAGPVGEFMLNQMAAVAALEAGLISERTKAALTAARVRGVKLGGWRGGPKVSSAVGVKARQKKADEFAASVGPIASALQSQGLTLHQIAAELTERDIRTPHDSHWNATAVRNLLARLDEIARRHDRGERVGRVTC
jgi:DNA invertase Pin-like site-specific DNA recombinase